MAYVNSTPSGFVNISLAPEPSIQDDPSVNKVYGSGNSSGSAMSSSGDSYSASLLVNLNLMAYVNSTPSGFVNISPAPEPSIQDDPSVNKVYGSGNSSGSAMSSSGDSSSGRSTIKSANIFPFIDSALEVPLVLKNGSDFSADFDRNLFKLASFLFSFCASLRHPGDGRLRTAFALSGHTFSPSAFTL
ncbi:hypothetical protein Tco_1513073 [Tanacetum coccineum]